MSPSFCFTLLSLENVSGSIKWYCKKKTFSSRSLFSQKHEQNMSWALYQLVEGRGSEEGFSQTWGYHGSHRCPCLFNLGFSNNFYCAKNLTRIWADTAGTEVTTHGCCSGYMKSCLIEHSCLIMFVRWFIWRSDRSNHKMAQENDNFKCVSLYLAPLLILFFILMDMVLF